MAFATTNVQGGMVFGPIKIFCGDWSGLNGDAAGTITLGGGRVYLVNFQAQDSSGGPVEIPPPIVSVSGNSITLTVNNRKTVTNGRFLIIYS